MRAELTARMIVDHYEALFDPLVRAAQRAVIEYTHLTQNDGWPTPLIVCDFARLYGVPAAELGAFFGLLSYVSGGQTVWVDALRGPVHFGVAQALATERQALAWGFQKLFREVCAADVCH